MLRAMRRASSLVSTLAIAALSISRGWIITLPAAAVIAALFYACAIIFVAAM